MEALEGYFCPFLGPALSRPSHVLVSAQYYLQLIDLAQLSGAFRGSWVGLREAKALHAEASSAQLALSPRPGFGKNPNVCILFRESLLYLCRNNTQRTSRDREATPCCFSLMLYSPREL